MNRTILITGATGNLGKEVVQLLHEEGNKILAIYHKQELDDAFKQKVTLLEHLDLNEENETQTAMARMIRQFPELDAAILLAGGFESGKIGETDLALLDQQFMLNFKTAWNVVKPVMDHFLKIGRGQFIFIGARPAISPEAGRNNVAYALSKSLLFSLAEIINAEGKALGISAAVIVPSILDTPPNRADIPKADFSKWVQPADVAETIRFILSPVGQQLRQPVFKIYNRS